MEGFHRSSEETRPVGDRRERKDANGRLLAEGANIRQASKNAGVNHETLRRYVRKGLIEAAPAGVSTEAAEGAELAKTRKLAKRERRAE